VCLKTASQNRAGIGKKIQSFLSNPRHQIIAPLPHKRQLQVLGYQIPPAGGLRYYPPHLPTPSQLSFYKVAAVVSGPVAVSLALSHWVAAGARAAETLRVTLPAMEVVS